MPRSWSFKRSLGRGIRGRPGDVLTDAANLVERDGSRADETAREFVEVFRYSEAQDLFAHWSAVADEIRRRQTPSNRQPDEPRLPDLPRAKK